MHKWCRHTGGPLLLTPWFARSVRQGDSNGQLACFLRHGMPMDPRLFMREDPWGPIRTRGA